MPPSTHPRTLIIGQSLRGILLMLASTALITTMVVGVRWLAEEMHAFEIALFRNLFGLLALTPLLLRSGPTLLRTQRLGMLSLRAILNSISMLLFFLAITLVPIAKIAAFGFTTPLFVTVLAVLILRERLGWVRAIGLAIGFGGALIVLRPGLEVINIGSIYALGSAGVWAFAIMVTKMLSRTESSVTITFYGAMIMVPVTLVPALFVWTTPTLSQLAGLVLLGAIWMSAQLCMTQALKFADASLVMPFDFAKLIWGAIAGFIFFTEVPAIWTWIGGSLILGATTYVGVSERNRNQATKKSS